MIRVLFDLDGTIIDSFEGITKCVQYALKSQGVEVESQEELRDYIGPPLKYSFQKHYDFDDETTDKLIRTYRERFDETGIFENELYPGVEEALRELKNRGYKIALASSKPENACRRILDQHGLLNYFDEVVGASTDGRISTKESVLLEVLHRMELSSPREAVLIGDTVFDVEGARQVGMDCIAVTYGFGSREDLRQAGAACICEDLEEVVRKIEGYKAV